MNAVFSEKWRWIVVVVVALGLVVAPSVSGDPTDVRLKLWNESTESLVVIVDGKTLGDAVPPAAHSPKYLSIPLPGPSLSVTIQDKTDPTISSEVTLQATDVGNAYSVFAFQASTGSPLTLTTVLDRLDHNLNDGMDTARMRVFNAFRGAPGVDLHGVTSNCFKCAKPVLCTLATGELTSDACHATNPDGTSVDVVQSALLLDVRHDYTVDIRRSDSGAILTQTHRTYQEHSVHTVILRGTSSFSFVDVEDVEGNNTWVPLGIAFGTLFGIAIVYKAAKLGVQACGNQDVDEGDNELTEDTNFIVDRESVSVRPRHGGRIEALDTFRGMSLTIMIFVNYGGGGYWFLDHSRWNGLTVADLVFPWFMWMAGLSCALSLASQRRKAHASRWQMTYRMTIRCFKLFLLGMFLNGGTDLYNWRIPGVLQYFGVSILINSWLEIWLPRSLKDCCCCSRSSASTEDSDEAAKLLYEDMDQIAPSRRTETSASGATSVVVEASGAWLGDILPYSLHFLFMAGVLAVYLFCQYGIDVPGCGRGYIGPGGLADYGTKANCTGGAHRYIDIKIWGEHHMYHDLYDGTNIPKSAATCADTYGCQVYDPEGTLGSLTATVMTFLGLQAGRIIVHHRHKPYRSLMLRWVVWGLVLGLIGGGLCEFRKNGGFMPISKNLWSPSFIAVLSGLAYLILAVFYYMVDVAKLWSGAPFRFVGKNSILVYAGSEILQNLFPFTFVDHSPDDQFGGTFRTHTGALASNILGVGCWCVLAYIWHRNKFYYRF